MRTLSVIALLALIDGCGFKQRRTAAHPVSYRFLAASSHESRRAFGRHLRQLLDHGDYNRLEEIAGDFRTSHETASDGVWRLRYFYKDGFDEHDEQIADFYPPVIAKLEAWAAARPRSITAPVALAYAYIGYAWEARTGKVAADVRDDQWRRFATRLEEAQGALQRGANLPERCPCWYLAAQNLALGQGWERAAYESLFTAATRTAPDFDSYYEFKAMYLQPRWYGTPGEWQRFALESASALPDSQGARRYARIVWNLFLHHRGLLLDENVRWPLAREGLELLLSRHPESLETMSAYCWLACEAQDRATARRLFERIGPRVDLDTWVDARLFMQSRAWAMQNPS